MFFIHLYHNLFIKSIMKSGIFSFLTKFFVLVFILLSTNNGIAQEKTDSWQKVRFGGGLGLGFNSGYFSGTISPSAVYDIDEIFSVGLGIQGSYVSQKNEYTSYIYGGSAILLINPINEIQLSAELEQLNVNVDYEHMPGFSQVTDNFWTTALFLGAGFRTQNVTVGIKYNVLHDDKKNVYDDAIIPFIRVYF